jgi:hypothetical protein
VLNEASIENILRTIDHNHERPEYDGRIEYDGRMKAMKALKAEIGMMASWHVGARGRN